MYLSFKIPPIRYSDFPDTHQLAAPYSIAGSGYATLRSSLLYFLFSFLALTVHRTQCMTEELTNRNVSVLVA